MNTFIDLTGQRFGRWVVLELKSKTGVSRWRCRCDCGRIKDAVQSSALKNGRSQSCGCLRSEQLAQIARNRSPWASHPGYRRTNNIYQSMITRCHNAKHYTFKYYGSRGITVCERWRESIRFFIEDMGYAPEGLEIERNHNDKGYCKENCRWATRAEQARNRRNNQWFMWKGERRTLTDIARMEGVAFCSFRNRVMTLGLTISEAVEYCRSRGLTYKERAASWVA